MTAEERLEEARAGLTLDRHEREDQVADLAREAIALLREIDEWVGADLKAINGETHIRLKRFLDGEER